MDSTMVPYNIYKILLLPSLPLKTNRWCKFHLWNILACLNFQKVNAFSSFAYSLVPYKLGNPFSKCIALPVQSHIHLRTGILAVFLYKVLANILDLDDHNLVDNSSELGSPSNMLCSQCKAQLHLFLILL